MSLRGRVPIRTQFLVGAIAGVALLAVVPPVHARVTRIIIDATGTLPGQDIPYQTLTGRAFGEPRTTDYGLQDH